MAFNLFNVAAGVVNEFTPHLRTAIVEKTNEIKTAVENAAACIHQEVGRTVQDKVFNVHEDPNVVFVQEQAGVTLVKFLNDLENTYKSANEKYQIDEMRAKIDEFVKQHKLNDPKYRYRVLQTKSGDMCENSGLYYPRYRFRAASHRCCLDVWFFFKWCWCRHLRVSLAVLHWSCGCREYLRNFAEHGSHWSIHKYWV